MIPLQGCCLMGPELFAPPSVQDVINVSKKFLPGMAKGFFSPKLTLHVGDGFEFMKQNNNAFDVIITDSSDPVGKSYFYICPLFLSFSRNLNRVLFFFICVCSQDLLKAYSRSRIFSS